MRLGVGVEVKTLRLDLIDGVRRRASIQSTCFDNSAAVRALASGKGISTTLSTRGMRSLFQ